MRTTTSIQCFKGKALKPYLPSIARIRREVYREYPYLYDVELEQEQEYLSEHLLTDDSIAVIAFDGSTIVGVSTGARLENEPETIQSPFINEGLDVSCFYYFGKSFLLKPYRGRGIWRHFFDIRESHAQSLKSFRHICFSSILRPEEHPLKPNEYLFAEDFWKKRGYTHRLGMRYHLQWKDPTEETPSDKAMIIWTKDLP